VQSDVSFGKYLRYKNPHVTTAILVFCALIFTKIHYHLARSSSVDLTPAEKSARLTVAGTALVLHQIPF
jgi:hypothetical protein